MKKILCIVTMLLSIASASQAQELIKDIAGGTTSSHPKDFINLNDSVALFRAYDTTHGTELWRTDGTTIGTYMIKDIDPGQNNSYPTFIDTINGKIVFFARTTIAGNELWVTDGTEVGTTMLADIEAGSNSTFPYELVIGHANNKIFVIADNSPQGTELCATDGTPAGTGIVKDICPGVNDGLGSYSHIGCAMGNKVYFASFGTSGSGRELWASDGTSAGTTSVYTLFLNFPTYLSDVGGEIVFSVSAGATGQELWVSNGTGAGTMLASGGDIYAGASSSSPDNFVSNGQMAYFTANNGTTGNEWYYYAGTTFSCTEIVPGNSGPAIETIFNPKPDNSISYMYLSANDYIHGNELFYINPFNFHVGLLRDINPTGSSEPDDLTYYESGYSFFTADDGEHGRELWTTDGTPSGTRRLTDMIPGYGSSVFSNSALVNGKLVFAGDNGFYGTELFAINFSAALGITDDLSSVSEINIYPNPVIDNFIIDLPKEPVTNTSITIWNNLGQECLSIPIIAKQGKRFTIDASSLSPGIYSGSIITDQITYRFRLVKN